MVISTVWFVAKAVVVMVEVVVVVTAVMVAMLGETGDDGGGTCVVGCWRVAFSVALDEILLVKLSLSSISNPADNGKDVLVFKVFNVAVECFESFVVAEETFRSVEPLEFVVSFFFARSLLATSVKPANKLISLIILHNY